MSQTLKEIAESLKNAKKKVQLIYAFNGIGKTRLSREYRLLVAPKDEENEEGEGIGVKVLYYNAFTEDLFYWDNDLDTDQNRKLIIRPNGFTNLALNFLKDQGLDVNIVSYFQHYTSPFLTPRFSQDFSEVSFSIESGNENSFENIKISRGEESSFVWCIFYSLLEQVIEIKNTELENRPDSPFNNLEAVFIDDPVSSLDDNHLIELAVNLAELIKKSTGIKFVVSTHNPLFYNVLFNEVGNKICYMLNKLDDGTYNLKPLNGDSNKSFSYHLYLKKTIEDAIASNSVEKYHFMLLRNLYEKTANFLGYPEWKRLLPEDRQLYYNRIIQFTSHSTLSNEVVPEPSGPEKQTVKLLLEHLVNSKYWKEELVNEVTPQAVTEASKTQSEDDTI